MRRQLKKRGSGCASLCSRWTVLIAAVIMMFAWTLVQALEHDGVVAATCRFGHHRKAPIQGESGRR